MALILIKHKWELSVKISSHFTSVYRSLLLCQVTVILAGCNYPRYVCNCSPWLSGIACYGKTFGLSLRYSRRNIF